MAWTLTLALAVSAPSAAEGQAGTAPPEMTTYQMALLSRSPGAPPLDEREHQALRDARLEFMDGLLEEGKLLAEGPLFEAEKLQGVVVLDVRSTEEARAILARDPWVRGGRVTAELHTWWAAKDVLRKPATVREQEWCYLGLLRRPPDAPDLPEERLLELQRGHLANIQAMADRGDLIIAGPFETENGALRGVLVFRNMEAEAIREQVARDPAVAAGRLALDLHGWRVAAGTLPAPRSLTPPSSGRSR